MNIRLELVSDRSAPGAPRGAKRPTGGERTAAAAPRGELAFLRPPERAAEARPRRRLGDDQGAVTAEYAIVILAGVAFAGLLVAIMRSEEIRAMLVRLVENALGAGG
ncbi:DUF4244 domain-containing protein [Leucobacter sp.]